MGADIAPDLKLEGLVHDLNNVFETVSDAAELLAREPKWENVAAMIRRSVDRGRRIVGSLSAGALGEHDCAGIVENSVEFARDLLQAVRAPEVRIISETDPGLRLSGSAAAWERVLLNLLLNAAQAMPRGGVIAVRARRTETGVEVCVSDDGPGIADDILPHIFEPHFSTKSSRSGLGLHIVESLVRQNGGEVTAANRSSGAGAEFYIRIPAAKT